MKFLSDFYSESPDKQVSISATQGNDFAKFIADDFNPIHDTHSKRFCVPGDLLFAIALERYGIYESMNFQFRELVKADTLLTYPEASTPAIGFDVICERSKAVLGIKYDGTGLIDALNARCAEKVEQLIRSYVVFSGQNFPNILVPLMLEHNVMINPKRPLVIYESMSLHFDRFDYDNLNITLSGTELEVQGKRGNAKLYFSLNDGVEQIGTGSKQLVLSGLREYDQQLIDIMCEEYNSSKNQRLPQN